MSTIKLKDADGNPVNVEAPLPPGRAAMGSSRPVAMSNEDLAVFTAIKTAIERGDATNGLDVDVTRMAALIAGEAHIGSVGGHTQSVRVKPTIDVGAYLANDAVFNLTPFPAFARITSGGRGRATLFKGLSTFNPAVGINFYLFNAVPTTSFVRNGTVAWNAADFDTLITPIYIGPAAWIQSANLALWSFEYPMGHNFVLGGLQAVNLAAQWQAGLTVPASPVMAFDLDADLD